MNGPYQVGFFERFGQEVDRASLDGAHRRGIIAVSRDGHDVWVRSLAGLVQQVESVDVGRLNVQEEASRHIGFGYALYSAAEPNVTTCRS
jgi:hypothetical protein